MKNDSIIQSTVKRTTLANLIIWMEKSGERVKSTSELVRTCLEVLEEQIMESGITNITQTDEAIKIVETFLNGNFNPSGRSKKNLYCNLVDLSSTSLNSRKQKILESKKLDQEELNRIIKNRMENKDIEE